METKKKKRAKNSILIIIFLVCLFPFVASTLLYFFWKPNNYTNYGEIVSYENFLQNIEFENKDLLKNFRGKWLLTSFHAGECNEICDKKLYLMRQLRLSQGKNMDRLERVFVFMEPKDDNFMLNQSYNGTYIIEDFNRDKIKNMPFYKTITNNFFLIDPFGNLMMIFPEDPNPSKIKKDLSKLLKVSKAWKFKYD